MYQNWPLDSPCPTAPAKIGLIMNLTNAMERLRDVLRRQHKALSTEGTMGHSSLETTMGYLHAESLSVRSPLEMIMGGNLQPGGNPMQAQAAARAPLFPKSAWPHPV